MSKSSSYLFITFESDSYKNSVKVGPAYNITYLEWINKLDSSCQKKKSLLVLEFVSIDQFDL
jgi:hypothetical protein